MKVMQLVSATGLNGAIRHCYELSVQLALAGHEVLLAHKEDAWISHQPFPAGVELTTTTLKRNPSELRRMAYLAKDQGVDVLHSHLSSAHFFGVLLGRMYRLPCVATCHMTHFQPHWFWNDRVIAPASSTARYQRWVNLVPSSRIDIIPYFLATDRFQAKRTRSEVRHELGLGEQQFVVTVVGQVCHRKAQHIIVRSIPEIVRQRVDLQVLFAGPVSNDYKALIHGEIEQLGVQNRVSLLGNRTDTSDLYAASDCACLSSNREVLPLGLLEAMGQGLPVVSTNVGGIADGIRDGVDGFLVRPRRPKELADRIVRIATDDVLRQQMGANAAERIRTVFSPESCIAQVVRCYDQACQSRQSRSKASRVA